jgi:hypothetical protein
MNSQKVEKKEPIEAGDLRSAEIVEKDALPEESAVDFLRGARFVPLPWEKR